jgi:hypothetical protein
MRLKKMNGCCATDGDGLARFCEILAGGCVGSLNLQDSKDGAGVQVTMGCKIMLHQRQTRLFPLQRIGPSQW